MTTEVNDTTDAGGDEGAASAEEQRISNIVNKALSGRLARVLPKALSESLEAHLAPIREQLGATRGNPADAQRQVPSGGVAADSEIARKYADLERKFQESEKARASERMQGHRARAFDGVRGALVGKARPEAIESALKVLKADDRIGVREDGTPYMIDGDEEVTIDEGVKRFMKSKDGALFAPAPSPATRKTGPKVSGRTAPVERTETAAERSLRMMEENRARRG